MVTEENCPICLHPLQAQIEAKYIQGEMSAVDIVANVGDEHIDLMGVLIHFNDHPMAVEKEAEKKARNRRLRDIESGPKHEPKSSEEEDYKIITVPAKRKKREYSGSNRVETLEEMLEVLKSKFNELMLTKQLSGIANVSREIRETMREIDKVKKEDRATQADRTADLFTEHRSMNRFLLHNLCEPCMNKYEEWLKGTQEADISG